MIRKISTQGILFYVTRHECCRRIFLHSKNSKREKEVDGLNHVNNERRKPTNHTFERFRIAEKCLDEEDAFNSLPSEEKNKRNPWLLKSGNIELISCSNSYSFRSSLFDICQMIFNGSTARSHRDWLQSRTPRSMLLLHTVINGINGILGFICHSILIRRSREKNTLGNYGDVTSLLIEYLKLDREKVNNIFNVYPRLSRRKVFRVESAHFIQWSQSRCD